ncbi:sigma-70 family RNA polymerase sigma factor [Dethiothermospora halolimnae]|uniref:sigma-70 family RNA polymerase sigma factor n=1 Tax=Dethiothermospora halolimnae TaxID=3114390 RepID=UPI003CCC0C6A
MEDVKLIKKAKKGDKEALVKLIMNRKKEFYKIAYVYMKNKHDALDAMEDMIVSVYENIDTLRNDKAFYGWSKTILVNCCKKRLKNNNMIIPVEKIYGIVGKNKYENLEKNIDIHTYLKSLNKKQQEAIKLRYFLDLDYKTIAKIMKTPEGTVKSRISLGLKKLKKSFGGDY